MTPGRAAPTFGGMGPQRSRALRTLRAVVPAASLATLACSLLSEPKIASETFSLRSVGEQALPVQLEPLPGDAAGPLLRSGSLTLQSNGSIAFRVRLEATVNGTPADPSELLLRGVYNRDGSTIQFCLGSGCELLSGSPARLMAGTQTGGQIVTPALVLGVGGPFRFERD